MVAGLDGDGAAYRLLLEWISRHLRSYYRGAGLRAPEEGRLRRRIYCRKRCWQSTPDGIPTTGAELFTPWMYAYRAL
jgi:hypothetical protein